MKGGAQENFHKAFSRIVPVILCVFFCCTAAYASSESENKFTVERIGQMICNGENRFSVCAPEDGEFTAVIYDEVCTYRVISEKVRQGITEVRWDGCGYNGEQMRTKYYFFDFSLRGVSGNNYSFFFESSIVKTAQHLQFVLPSLDTAYLTDPEGWFVELKSAIDGSVVFELYSDENKENPLNVAEKTVHCGRIEHFTLQDISGRSTPDAGIYTVKIYERSRTDEASEFPLTILDGPAVKIPVSVTGSILPERGAEDSEIWKAMMQPSVVADIDPMNHLNIYAEQDLNSKCIGTLHGQTQGLAVLEIRREWAKIGAWNHEDASYVEGWVLLKYLKVIEPNPQYGLLIDKKSQTMTVFQNGERIEMLLVSTGRMDPDKYDRETSAGCFLTGLHRVDFSTQGLKYDYVIQYDGGNLLHQIPYSSDGKKDFTQGKAYLGTKASHACIRIQDTPGSRNGVNAYWIWTHIPYRTRVMILDDPEERIIEKARLSGGEPYEMENCFTTQGTVHDENKILFTFAGDMIPVFSEAAGFDELFRRGPDYPLEKMQELFEQDDLTCVSLACVLKEEKAGEVLRRTIKWRGLPEYADVFSSSSVELVSLGDEHLYDYRQEGFDITAGILEKSVAWTGKDHPQMIKIKGCLFGFATIRQEDYLADMNIISREIHSLREAGCAYVIVQCHWGNENDEKHGKLQEAMARICAREGADLVIGRHPESVQGIGEINGMPVVYSMGRLITDRSVKQKSFISLAVQAVFDPEEKERPEIRLIPLIQDTNENGKINGCRPVPAKQDEKERILNIIQSDTGFKISRTGEN